MNGKEKQLLAAINGTERMSGFDSYDSAEGDSYFDDMDSFDGNDMSYFDGNDMSYAGGNAPQAISQPYVLSYENTTSGDLTAIIFGYNDYFGASNYGNPAGITITNLQGGTYGRLISQSNNKFFKIGKLRFQCTTPAQLQQTLNINHFDANGKTQSTPLNLSILRDAYQQQSDLIDVTEVITVDGNTSITFTLIAGAVLTIAIFPIALLSGKAALNGGKSYNTARAPRLSGKNVSPVIIQTTQGVGGVSKR
jgi:hypothetical protein